MGQTPRAKWSRRLRTRWTRGQRRFQLLFALFPICSRCSGFDPFLLLHGSLFWIFSGSLFWMGKSTEGTMEARAEADTRAIQHDEIGKLSPYGQVALAARHAQRLTPLF